MRALKSQACCVFALLSAVLCLVRSSQHVIHAGNGSYSLASYLNEISMNIPSFTTLVFTTGLHYMCEDTAVVIRDATNISLIGSNITHTRTQQAGNRETVHIIEPSTVIDCQECPTGFVFLNVTHLVIERISMQNCGAYHDSLVNGTQFISSLTLALVNTATLDTLSFHGIGRNYHLVAINLLGASQIKNISILQEVHDQFNIYLPFSHKVGGILFFLYSVYEMTGHLQSFEDSSGLRNLSIDSLMIFYTVNFEIGPDPVLQLDITSCAVDDLIHLMLQNVAVHVQLDYSNKLVHPEAVVSVAVDDCVTGYQLSVKNVRLSASYSPDLFAHLMYGFVLLFTGNSLSFSESNFPLKTMNFSEFEFSGDYRFHVFKSGSTSNQWLYFENCKFSHVSMTNEDLDSDNDTLHITIKNSSFVHTALEHFDDDSLFEATGLRDIEIINCMFSHNTGPGIHLTNTQVRFSGNCVIYNNSAEYGGGMLMLGSETRLHLTPHTILNFTDNTARVTGGAMHIDVVYSSACLIQIDTGLSSYEYDIQLIAEEQDIRVVFDSNMANVAGTTIWGGEFDEYRWCYMRAGGVSRYIDIVPLLGVYNNATNLSVIASTPRHMCYCNSSKTPVCTPFYSTQEPSFSLYAGQSLELDLAMAGQLNGLVPGLVEANLYNDNYNMDDIVHIDELQRTQRIERAECKRFVYTFTSMAPGYVTTTLNLHIAEDVTVPLEYQESQNTYSLSFLNDLSIDITLKQCPLGFHHNSIMSACTCLTAILKYVNDSSCDINTQTVERMATLWLNASYMGNNTQILAVHEHCPFNYCDDSKLRIDLRNPDQQCSHSRAGILCGGCGTGLSLTLGSPKCRQCSSNFLSLLVVFTFAGIALVAVLTLLNLTVSAGTINALILYANVVRALNPIFFQSTNFLSVFVAWLNLDIGLNSCFYDGLDFYALTWLQFVFPVYIWLLVSSMIFTSHYSTLAAKLVSRDAVKVLATLFLLSYAKLLRTILTVFSFTYITYEMTNGTIYRNSVWLYDGNVEFLTGKHIPLFLVAAAFGVLYIIPFTALLLFAPCLQRRSHKFSALRWVNKVMPFFDAYQGPYTNRFRFWPGLTLLVRVILFMSYALNSLGEPDINLIITVCVIFGLLSFQLALGTMFNESAVPYTNIYINYLEIFCFLDLGFLCAWSSSSLNGQQSAISGVLVGIIFLMFVGILCYHTYIRMKANPIIVRFCKKIRTDSSTRSPASSGQDMAQRKITHRVPITYVETPC